MHWSILHLLAVGLATASSTHDTCKFVETKIPGRITYPGTTTYNLSLSSYYSSQERSLSPNCIIRPTNTSEVSQFIKLVTSKEHKTNFAVRGGGHTLWSGAANIDSGRTCRHAPHEKVESEASPPVEKLPFTHGSVVSAATTSLVMKLFSEVDKSSMLMKALTLTFGLL